MLLLSYAHGSFLLVAQIKETRLFLPKIFVFKLICVVL